MHICPVEIMAILQFGPYLLQVIQSRGYFIMNSDYVKGSREAKKDFEAGNPPLVFSGTHSTNFERGYTDAWQTCMFRKTRELEEAQ